MMQNPEFLRQLASPETMQLLLAVQQSLMSQFGRQQQQSTQETGQTGGTTVPPEELYAAQLSQLQEMGFFDQQENIRALMATAGKRPCSSRATFREFCLVQPNTVM
ncbi:hypothetical protein GBA52_029160 [Prunus armeniaca]|nr:hypothetical protein GBA52_029160 [Prunus armeniaca]